MRNTVKRIFDITGATVGLLFFGWIIILAWLVIVIETSENGFFVQKRVGLDGKLFTVIKIKTMRSKSGTERHAIASLNKNSITKVGEWLRKYKIDELPQLVNILLGEMSFVGPRPDVPGYADKLIGEDRLILRLRPGITGPASIKYKNEDEILSSVDNPIQFNDEIIWPDKVKINLDYYYHHNLMLDLKYIINTIRS